MVALGKLSMSDISRQKRYDTQLDADGISTEHTVGQAVEHYLSRVGIRSNGLRWSAFSRGVKLDSKQSLGDLPDTQTDWIVMPEISAGGD